MALPSSPYRALVPNELMPLVESYDGTRCSSTQLAISPASKRTYRPTFT